MLRYRGAGLDDSEFDAKESRVSRCALDEAFNIMVW